jgi:peptidoglycan/LPS O-acetylase OafA/YrhL
LDTAERTIAYRPDIDGLRAVAILAVVMFHVFPRMVPGGFAGVDMFFALSGFLISGIIQDGLAAGDFRFYNFYLHRVRRIFPALLIVIATALITGWFVFLPDEYSSQGNEAAAGSLFVSNIFYWMQARFAGGYFNSRSQYNTLMHLWSLSVEEQFYIAWPLAMAAAFRFRHGIGTVIVTGCLLSFACCAFLAYGHPIAVFYAPVTRFWEILLGAALAFLARHHLPLRKSWIANTASCVGICLIATAFAMPNDATPYPSIAVLMPVLGIMSVISAGRSSWINRVVLSARSLVYVGRISYPLYLWHWLLFAALHTVTVDMPSVAARIVVVALSFALAIATYEFLEKPIRAQRSLSRVAAVLVPLLLLVGLAGLLLPPLRGAMMRASGTSGKDSLQWDRLTDDACETRYQTQQRNWVFCRTNSKAPAILLVGDSHANHLYPGLIAEPDLARHGIVNLGACWPVNGIVRILFSENKASGCSKYAVAAQSDFLGHLAKNIPSIRYAIISAAWRTYAADGSEHDRFTGELVAATFYSTVPGDKQSSQLRQYLDALERDISQLERQNIRVVLALDVPQLPYDVRLCIQRPLVGRLQNCVTDARSQRAARSQFLAGLDVIRSWHNLPLFDPLGVFCGTRYCDLAPGGHALLRDSGHLSVTGSMIVGSKFRTWAAAHVPGLLTR